MAEQRTQDRRRGKLFREMFDACEQGTQHMRSVSDVYQKTSLAPQVSLSPSLGNRDEG